MYLCIFQARIGGWASFTTGMRGDISYACANIIGNGRRRQRCANNCKSLLRQFIDSRILSFELPYLNHTTAHATQTPFFGTSYFPSRSRSYRFDRRTTSIDSIVDRRTMQRPRKGIWKSSCIVVSIRLPSIVGVLPKILLLLLLSIIMGIIICDNNNYY